MVGIPVEEHFLPFHTDQLEASEKFKASQNLASLVASYKNGKFVDTNRGVISGLSGLIRAIRNEDGNATIEDFEALREKCQVLNVRWKSRRTLTVIMSDGTIAHLTLKNVNTQEVAVRIDKSLRHTDAIIDVAYAHKVVIFLFEDNRLLIARTYEPTQAEGGAELVQPEFTIDVYHEFLPHLASRKTDKTIAISDDREFFVIWWPASKDDVFPWSPKPEDRANILIYRLHQYEMPELISFLKTDHALLDASFVPSSTSFSTLELEEDSEDSAVVVEILYDLFTMARVSETAIPIQSEYTCYAYDLQRKRLAIGCCDSSVVIYSYAGRITLYTKAPFIPRHLSWHPDSYLLFVAGDDGRFQLFDIALNPMLLLSSGETVPSVIREFVSCGPVKRLLWSPWPTLASDSNLLIQFESGPMIVLRFAFGNMSLLELTRYYLDNGESCEAIKVLRSIYWDSDACLRAMYMIFGELIKHPHSDQLESELESLLVIYFVPTYGGDEAARKKHSKSLRILARRFFMWLLPAGKLQRAMQVATSLGEPGLFEKLRHVANVQGNQEIASVALESMESLLSSSSGSSGSSCDESNSSSCTHSDDCSSCCSSAGSSSESSTEEESSPEDVSEEITHHVLVPEVPTSSTQVGSLRVLPLESEPLAQPQEAPVPRSRSISQNAIKADTKPNAKLPAAALRMLTSANNNHESSTTGGGGDISDIQVVNLGLV